MKRFLSIVVEEWSVGRWAIKDLRKDYARDGDILLLATSYVFGWLVLIIACLKFSIRRFLSEEL